jgi:CO dehydrogenase/acetyl-CoA synthase alpha subunit
MVDLEGGEYFALDKVGARMWELLVAGETPARIAVILTSEYAAHERNILGDCIDLTEQLLKRGLLVLQQP